MAIREPRRIAIALLLDALGQDAFQHADTLMPVRSRRGSDLAVMKRMIETGVNTPLTSSVGRLFDGVAAIIGLRQITSYSGQAAIELEGLTGHATTSSTDAYSFDVCNDGPCLIVDWRPTIRQLVNDVQSDRDLVEMATAFHNGIALAMVKVAKAIGEPTVALSGGCFQNRTLAERAKAHLETAGFTVYLHRDVPPNDGGLAVGQIACAAFEQEREIR
jgi:hydrogenase maturation protein HypF